MYRYEMDDLPDAQCWAVLRALSSGWLIYSHRMLPALDPISDYTVAGGSIFFHAPQDLPLHRHAVASLHVHLTSPGGATSASVVAHGRVREASAPASDPRGDVLDLSKPISRRQRGEQLALDVRILHVARFAPPLRCEHRHLAVAGSEGNSGA